MLLLNISTFVNQIENVYSSVAKKKKRLLVYVSGHSIFKSGTHALDQRFLIFLITKMFFNCLLLT